MNNLTSPIPDSDIPLDPITMVSPNELKLENDIQVLGEKILQHEVNITFLKDSINSLDNRIAEMQVALSEHRSSSTCTNEGNVCSHIRSTTETVDQILLHEKSAAAILCELTRRGDHFSQISTIKDVIGVVATLGHVEDMALSRHLSEYLGLDMMLALVCKTYDVAKALASEDEQGIINKRTGLYGLGASIGRILDGHFNVICLEDLIPYFGEFMPDDPQRRLALPKPKLPNGESPAGFLGFAVNMIHLDSVHLSFVTNNGYGLRETLFYSLFSTLQVYKTKTDMLKALPYVSDDAVSMDGEMTRSRGVITIGNRKKKDLDVNFPVCCRVCFPSENYFEIERQMKELKRKKDMVMEDYIQMEDHLAQVKFDFEAKKEEFIMFTAQNSLDAMQPVLQSDPIVLNRGQPIETRRPNRERKVPVKFTDYI